MKGLSSKQGDALASEIRESPKFRTNVPAARALAPPISHPNPHKKRTVGWWRRLHFNCRIVRVLRKGLVQCSDRCVYSRKRSLLVWPELHKRFYIELYALYRDYTVEGTYFLDFRFQARMRTVWPEIRLFPKPDGKLITVSRFPVRRLDGKLLTGAHGNPKSFTRMIKVNKLIN